MEVISVLIVDDHALFRTGIRKILETQEDIEVVGEAATGREALEQARALMPDVVLMDIKMPDLDGVEATRRLLGQMPHLGVLFCTMFEDDEFVYAGLQAGGRGYILKESEPKTMLRAIRAVYEGAAIFSPSIASRMMDFFAVSRNVIPQEAFSDLTDREREVLTLIARGESNADIARALTISIKTVRNHVSNIFGKLQVADRAQAVIRAREAGLG